MTDIVVDVQNLSRRYGQTQALDNVTFQAQRGKIYGLVGANGAGKTTLIKHLLGLLRAKSGSVSVFGLDPIKKPVEVLSRVGYLSEDRDIPDWMSIDELMDYCNGYHANWDEAFSNELLATFALDKSKKVKDLSRGMRAQVALVTAVAHRPDLLVLDEPSSGLDALVRKDILNAIVRTISEEGRTVIFSSHILEEVERLSDHVLMIQEGRITLDSPLETLSNSHHHSEIHFAEHLTMQPDLQGVLACTGAGRSWSAIHQASTEQLSDAVKALGGTIVETRNATLEEIFVARVGRPDKAKSKEQEAA